ncbi:hypothetical protein BDA96_04G271600 [Sorghum bicolor]|uniref:Uncharacterized protein n=1 Tax=Sorghum bicolor TaxID=4558 RepID=A0A921ULV2_SORBI|nr:hypothetical protein BDA96_04G271600 [Sorghum bicolor]
MGSDTCVGGLGAGRRRGHASSKHNSMQRSLHIQSSLHTLHLAAHPQVFYSSAPLPCLKAIQQQQKATEETSWNPSQLVNSTEATARSVLSTVRMQSSMVTASVAM